VWRLLTKVLSQATSVTKKKGALLLVSNEIYHLFRK
jgi:hypothetical protein